MLFVWLLPGTYISISTCVCVLWLRLQDYGHCRPACKGKVLGYLLAFPCAVFFPQPRIGVPDDTSAYESERYNVRTTSPRIPSKGAVYSA